MTTPWDPETNRTETLLHIGDPARGRNWQAVLPMLVPGLTVRQWPDIGDPAGVRYVAAWQPPPTLFDRLPDLELVFSVGAGIDHIDQASLPGHVTLVRMIEPGLIQGMVEYATFAVLALHRDMLGHFDRQRRGAWDHAAAPPASARRIAILGLGEMGTAIATRLATFGFPVSGWSRSPRTIAGIHCVAGKAALPGVLAAADILICALPLTPETCGLIDATTIARLPRGAMIVNMGRGGHLDEAALLAAIDHGHIAGAVLDVAAQEPLPADHRFWSDPRILMTPHIAGTTDPAGGARAIAHAIERHRRGETPRGVVDRERGY